MAVKTLVDNAQVKVVVTDSPGVRVTTVTSKPGSDEWARQQEAQVLRDVAARFEDGSDTKQDLRIALAWLIRRELDRV